MRFFLITILMIFSGVKYTWAECDFNTSEKLKELQSPQSIESIDIKIRKSRKWLKNSLALIVKEGSTIPENFKHKFSSDVEVKYSFGGSCYSKAKVRISGDWKDHILFKDGQIYTSLDVKLKDDNVVNSVKFKLLLPDTRNGVNEIIAQIILRELGYITPNSFLVPVTVNNTYYIALFQEKPAKELLERNFRREGPLFEGNEKLVYQDDFDYELYRNISLSRLINQKWAEKGESSMEISTSAYLNMQSIYSAATHNRKVLMAPGGNSDDSLFSRYAIFTLTTNGKHALHSQNRKFYYNSLADKFEPVYFDGNVDFLPSAYFKKPEKEVVGYFIQTAGKNFYSDARNMLAGLLVREDLDSELADKARIERAEAKKLIAGAINAMISRLENLYQSYSTDHQHHYRRYIASYKSMTSDALKLLGSYYTIDDFNGKFPIEAKKYSKDGIELLQINSKDMISIMSDFSLSGQDTLLIPSDLYTYLPTTIKHLAFAGGMIQLSPGSSVSIDKKRKELIITQTSAEDWILFRAAEIKDWHIIFKGIDTDRKPEEDGQRFNSYGLTGCVTFYDSIFDKTSVTMNGGACEDSLNIVHSTGSLTKINIQDAFSDALDMDFSTISAESIVINGAGNDCIDISSGNYTFGNIKVSNCNDKGLSAGERSNTEVTTAFINNSSIGLASKDSSILNVKNFTGLNIKDACIAAYRKKQEFHGAVVNYMDMQCSAPIQIDEESSVRKTNEF